MNEACLRTLLRAEWSIYIPSWPSWRRWLEMVWHSCVIVLQLSTRKPRLPSPIYTHTQSCWFSRGSQWSAVDTLSDHTDLLHTNTLRPPMTTHARMLVKTLLRQGERERERRWAPNPHYKYKLIWLQNTALYYKTDRLLVMSAWGGTALWRCDVIM